jgi:hypothetical protein
MKLFSWGIPVDLPCPPGGEGPVPDWSKLKFNPLGLYNLRRRLGTLCKEPGIFSQYKPSFLASDIAWFAGGASEDGAHSVMVDHFHSAFDTLREHTPSGPPGQRLWNDVCKQIQGTTFDLVHLQIFPTHPQLIYSQYRQPYGTVHLVGV